MTLRSYCKVLSVILSLSIIAGGIGIPSVKASAEEQVKLEWRQEKDPKGEDGWFWYENGVKQGTEGRGKEIWDPVSDAWYWLDSIDGGKMAVSKDVYQESEAGEWGDQVNAEGKKIGKWVRYNADGHMIKGWDVTDHGTYYFDPIYGTMAKGDAKIDGVSYRFNKNTGVMEYASVGMGNKWVVIDGVQYWYEDGVRQGYNPMDASYRGKEIWDPKSDAWYWLDNVQKGAKAVSKDVYQESESGEWGDMVNAEGKRIGKWVRYDADGHMVKGWDVNENGTYYFDLIYGTMAKGDVKINGTEYKFDRTTGILQVPDGLKPKNVGVNEGSHEYLYDQWSSVVKSYFVPLNSGQIMRVQKGPYVNGVVVEYYNSRYELLRQMVMPEELPLFGGFYETENNYYLFWGQNNPNQSDQTEVIRVTKYDKNWNRQGSASLYGANTYEPFQAGSLRADHSGNYMIVRTSHTMYTTNDGLHHQANLTFAVDLAKMEITDSFSALSNSSKGYVSHSFNQFVKIDGRDIVAVDHGDAHPRSAVFFKYNTDFSQGKFTKNNLIYGDLLKFQGAVGNNKTGATLGGFEVSDTCYLLAGSSIVQDSKYLKRTVRSPFLSVVNKSTLKVSTIWVGAMYDDDKLDEKDKETSSNPHFVKIGKNQYMILWKACKEGKVYYLTVDGDGHTAKEAYSMQADLSDCAPVVGDDGILRWYVTDSRGITFYEIALSNMEGRTAQIRYY